MPESRRGAALQGQSVRLAGGYGRSEYLPPSRTTTTGVVARLLGDQHHRVVGPAPDSSRTSRGLIHPALARCCRVTREGGARRWASDGSPQLDDDGDLLKGTGEPADGERVTVATSWTGHVDDSGDEADRSYYESDTARAVLPVAATLAVFYAGFALVHHVVLGQDPGPVVGLVAGVSALVATVVAIAAWRNRIPIGRGHAVMALLVAMTAVDAALHLAITGDPQETVSFFILLVALGVALLHWSWFAPCAVGVWLAWLVAVAHVGGDALIWWHWAFSMAAASVLGVVVALLRRRSIDVAAAALREAVRAATEDAATGLANRRGLELLSAELVALSRRSGEIVHCTFLDVDGLKTINDEQGHDTGDRVILAVARAIRSSCRSGDIVARWGGDEFVVVGIGPSAAPDELKARVAAHLAQHHPGDPTLSRLSISVGQAELAPWDDGDTESLLWRADHDMYLRRAEQPAGLRRAFLPDPVRRSES